MLVTTDVWATIADYLGERTIAAIGYVGRNAAEVMPLAAGSTIVIDGSEAAVKCGATVPAGVEGFIKSGVKVLSIAGLHCKMLWTDSWGGVVVVGSANASQHSTTLIEAVVISDDPGLCGEVEREISALINLAEGDGELDLDWVGRMSILAPAHRPMRPSRASPRLPRLTPRRIWIFTWALDRRDLTDAENEALAGAERLHGVSRVLQFRVVGKFAGRIRVGDELMVIATRSPGALPRRTSLVEAPSRIVEVVDSRSSKGGALLIHLSTGLRRLKLGLVQDATEAADGTWTTDGPFRSARVVEAIRDLWTR